MYEEVTLGYGISLVGRRVQWDEVFGRRKAFGDAVSYQVYVRAVKISKIST